MSAIFCYTVCTVLYSNINIHRPVLTVYYICSVVSLMSQHSCGECTWLVWHISLNVWGIVNILKKESGKVHCRHAKHFNLHNCIHIYLVFSFFSQFKAHDFSSDSSLCNCILEEFVHRCGFFVNMCKSRQLHFSLDFMHLFSSVQSIFLCLLHDLHL